MIVYDSCSVINISLFHEQGSSVILTTTTTKKPPSVLESIVECLCCVVEFQTGNESLLTNMMDKFCRFLCKFEELETFEGQPLSALNSVQRALLVSGLLCRYFSFECFNQEEKQNDLFALFLHFSSLSLQATSQQDEQEEGEEETPDLKVKIKAIQALGFLFISLPHLLMRPKAFELVQSCFQDLQPFLVKSETLHNFSVLLTFEELRHKKGLAKTDLLKKTSKSSRTEELDTSAASTVLPGVMQIHLEAIKKLVYDKNSHLRIQALILLGIMLRQGLVNPLQCIEPMIALEADHVREVRNTAHSQLLAMHEKHPSFLISRAIHGIVESWHFQRQVFDNKVEARISETDFGHLTKEEQNEDHDEFARQGRRNTFSVFSDMYHDGICQPRKYRDRFLHSALALFDSGKSLMSSGGSESDNANANANANAFDQSASEPKLVRRSSSSCSISSIASQSFFQVSCCCFLLSRYFIVCYVRKSCVEC